MLVKNVLRRKNRLILAVIFVFFTLSLAAFLFSSVSPALAQPELGENYAANIGLSDGGGRDIRDLIVDVVRYLLTFLGIIAVIMIMYAGWLWMTSQGNPQQLEKAKKTLINAVIGLIVILLSFAIVTYIANLKGLGGPGSGSGGSGPSGLGGGIAVIGNCAIDSVYPEPGQNDVPRDTVILVTFREAVDPATVCNNSACNGDLLVPDNVRIYKNNTGDSCESGACTDTNVTDVRVYSNDNRTFSFVMQTILGSPSETIWYTVKLTSGITDPSGRNIFADCRNNSGANWQFEVSNRLDRTPPQVQSVYPPADSGQDTTAFSPGTRAVGSITVLAVPGISQSASAIADTGGGPWSNADVNASNSCTEGSPLTVDTAAGDPNQAFLRRGATLLGSGATVGNRVNFSYCGISLTLLSGDFEDPANCATGPCLWNINITPATIGDTLRVGSVNYSFVDTVPANSSQIQRGASADATAAQIETALGAHPQVEVVSRAGTTINIRARTPGSGGNSIALSTSNNSVFTFSGPALSGGTDTGSVVTAVDLRDQPRNVIIKINFNEAMFPQTLSGSAVDLAALGSIFIRCTGGACTGAGLFSCGGGTCVDGNFVMSNGYRTVEFIPSNECGMNTCGEPVFCLPESSQIAVEIIPASLEACSNSGDCTAKTPYNICTGGICEDSGGRNYPKAGMPLDGAADAAINSLDGDKDTEAEGSPADIYTWSFWLSDVIDTTPPEIDATWPNHLEANVPLGNAMTIDFSKMMMSSTLRSGSVAISVDGKKITHKLINLKSISGAAAGYWILTNDLDVPLKGGLPWTQAEIQHTLLPDTTSFRVSAGSGIKDIYQNCYRPGIGPECNPGGVNLTTPSCCGGSAQVSDICP